MIAYVESNFVIEVALGQEEAPFAEAILELAESGEAELAFPVFALSEPFATITHRGRERRRLSSSLTEQLRQLQRSMPHQDVVNALKPVPIALAEIEKKEIDLLELTVERLLRVGMVIGIDQTVFAQALAYQKHYGFSPQDSIIYASVIGDLGLRTRSEPKCFVNRNWKDFGDPGILTELSTYNCVYLEDFKSGLEFIKNGNP